MEPGFVASLATWQAAIPAATPLHLQHAVVQLLVQLLQLVLCVPDPQQHRVVLGTGRARPWRRPERLFKTQGGGGGGRHPLNLIFGEGFPGTAWFRQYPVRTVTKSPGLDGGSRPPFQREHCLLTLGLLSTKKTSNQSLKKPITHFLPLEGLVTLAQGIK